MPSRETDAFVKERLTQADPDWQHAVIFTPAPHRETVSALLTFYLELESIYFGSQDESLRANRLLWWQEEISALVNGSSAHPLAGAFGKPELQSIETDLQGMIQPPYTPNIGEQLGKHLFGAVALASRVENHQQAKDAGTRWGSQRVALINRNFSSSFPEQPEPEDVYVNGCPGLSVLNRLTRQRMLGKGELHPIRGLWLAWRAARATGPAC